MTSEVVFQHISKFVLIGLCSLVSGIGTTAAQMAYVTTTDGVDVVNTLTDDVVETVTWGGDGVGVAVNPSGTRAYVTASGNEVVVIDTATNSVLTTVTVGTTPVGVAVNPTGTRVYVTNYDQYTLSVIDTATNGIVATFAVGGVHPNGVAVNPAGTRVYVANSSSNTVSVIGTAWNSVLAIVNVGSFPIGVAVNPAGTRVYVANYGEASVSVIDTATNAVVATVSTGGVGPFGVAVNPAGTRLYVTNSEDYTVAVIDTATNDIVAVVPFWSHPNGVAVNPAGTRVYVTHYQAYDTVSVIDTATNTVVETLPVGEYPRGVAIGGCVGFDLDGDGIWGSCDNCPLVPSSDLTDSDHDGKGDLCDSDKDNDGCKNTVDEDPLSPVHKIGYYSRPPCVPSSGILYNYAGGDTDGDGLLDCEDPDDDNDGVPDGSDPCPVTPGTDAASCTFSRACLQPSLFDLCSSGGCEQFFLRLVPVLPDPSIERVYDHIQVVNDALYVYPIEGMTLEQTAATFAPTQGGAGRAAAPQTCDPVRLEVWAKEQPGSPAHFVMQVAEYDPCSVTIGPTERGAVLLITPPAQGGSAIAVDALWVAGTFPPSPIIPDADLDEFPDPFDNCEQAANTDQTDTDGDLAGDACDCAPADGSAFAIPGEVMGQVFAQDHVTMSWSPAMADAGSGVTYTVVRATLGIMDSDQCLVNHLADPSYMDFDFPQPGQTLAYVVGAENACGFGGYGTTSAGEPRESRAVCP